MASIILKIILTTFKKKTSLTLPINEVSHNLVREKPIIALYGSLQIGKSILLNCFMGRYAALTGNGLATTSLTARYRYGDTERIQYRKYSGELQDISIDELFRRKSFTELTDMAVGSSFNIEARIPSELLRYCDIVDTPGFNANAKDTDTALGVLENVNYCLYVISNLEMKQLDRTMLRHLCMTGIPISVIMNCKDGRSQKKWIPSHPVNVKFIQAADAWLKSAGLEVLPLAGQNIFPCNALFHWSLQRDFEVSMKYIDQSDTVREDISELICKEGNIDSRENILSLSRITELIMALKERVTGYDPVSHKWRR